MIHADYLFLLTDVDGLYTSNPRKDPNAARIDIVSSIDTIRSQGKLSPSYTAIFALHKSTMGKPFLLSWRVWAADGVNVKPGPAGTPTALVRGAFAQSFSLCGTRHISGRKR